MVWYLSKHGIVHRDISDGNIYEYSGRGIVGDLEYMKRVSEDGSSDMRTVSEMGREIQTNGLIGTILTGYSWLLGRGSRKRRVYLPSPVWKCSS